MFRKIHSNRDPRDTLLSELKKEFSTYFIAGSNCFRSILQRNPRFTFGSMVFLMAASIVITLTLFHHH
ncbi:MAG TPA: hypothetical protein VG890_10645, partial [Puia sp.]|nr:hypothetical protein [Puia sp.]